MSSVCTRFFLKRVRFGICIALLLVAFVTRSNGQDCSLIPVSSVRIAFRETDNQTHWTGITLDGRSNQLRSTLPFQVALLPSVRGLSESKSDSLLTASDPPSAGTKLLWLGAASVVYGGIDYLGFNLTRNSRTARIGYRIFQAVMQGAITWFLYDQLGIGSAVAFNVIWWTFGLDWVYCGYAELVNPGSPWDSRGVVANCWMKNQVTWAYWTPVGVIRGIRRDDKIAGDTLIAQALAGAALAVTIAIAF